MEANTSWPIKQGVVRRIRSGLTPEWPALRGGIHQSFAPEDKPYPLVTYDVPVDPVVIDNGTMADEGTEEIRAVVDIEAWSRSSVEAENLDSLIAGLFASRFTPELDALVDGQRVYHLRRIGRSPGSGPAVDDEGRRYFRFGSSYEIWTTRGVPKPS